MRDPCRRLTVCAARIPIFALLISLVISFLPCVIPSASAAAAKLAWSAPSDNGPSGRASRYDLRISTRTIVGIDTLSWWNSATRITMGTKTPNWPGTTDSVLIAGLVQGGRYYAILRSADAASNWSAYSNVAMFTPSLVTGAPEGDQAPAFVLGAPRPSPSSGRTEINLDLPRAMAVNAGIFDAQGRLVRSLERGMLAAGPHILRWDGRLDGGGDAASGVYWVRVAAEKIDKKVRVIVVR